VVPDCVTVALYGDPAMMVWPAPNDQDTVHVWIVNEALLVTVTVAPKSGGLFDGVCQPMLKVAEQAAPVSAGALGAVTTTAVTETAHASSTAIPKLRKRSHRSLEGFPFMFRLRTAAAGCCTG
jgi:hypothetical protein